MTQPSVDLAPLDLVLGVSSFIVEELDSQLLVAIDQPLAVGQAVSLGVFDDIGDILDAITNLPGVIADAVTNAVLAAVDGAIGGATALVSGLDALVRDRFDDVLGSFILLIKSLDELVVDPIQNALEQGFVALDVINDAILTSVDSVLEQGKSLMETIGGALTIASQALGEVLVTIGRVLGDQVIEAAGVLKDAATLSLDFSPRGLFDFMGDDMVERLNPLLKLLDEDEDMPPEIKALTAPGGLLAIPVGGFIAAIAIPFLLAPALHTIITPWLNKVQQKVNQLAVPALLAPAELVNAFHRGLIPWEDVVRDGGKAGFKESDLAHLSTMLKLRPNTNEAIDFWRRELLTQEQFVENLTLIGWDAEQVSLLQLAAFPPPPVQDLITMAVREVFTPEVAERFGQFDDIPQPFIDFASQIGLSQEWATRYWGAHWALSSAQQGFQMLHRGVIQVPDLELLLRSLDVMPFWRDRLTQIAFTPFTRVDIRRMHKLGVLSPDQVLRAYLDLGYDENKAQLQLQFVLALNAEEERVVENRERDLTKGDVLGLFNDGILSEDEARDSLRSLGFSESDAILLVSRETLQRLASERKSDIQDVVSLGKAGIHTFTTAQDALGRLDLTVVEMALAMRQIERAAAVKTRQPSKADLDSWLENELIDVAVYQEELSNLGFDHKYITLYTQEVGIDVREAQESEEARAARAAEPRRETKSDLDRLRLAGVITATEYTDGLSGLGYTATAIARFGARIEREVEDQRLAILARDRAVGAVVPRTESKGDLDRLFLARIIDIVEYEAGLVQLGFDPDSVTNFVELVTQTRATRDQKIADDLAAGVEPTVDERLPSRTDLDRFALAGLISLQTYQNALRALGFAAGTVTLFTDLVRGKGAFVDATEE